MSDIFDHCSDAMEDALDGRSANDPWDGYRSRPDPRCNRCGSRDVRWRQQGGRWVLFSLTPGVVHTCAISTDGFDEVPE